MTSPLPQTMKSIHQPSKFSTHLELVHTPLPRPTDPTDVLVKVHATSPCAGELFWARDYAALIPDDKEPVPCSDLAGTVVKAPSTSSFRPGDAVYARVSANRPGCLREFTLAQETELALKPETLSFVESAATPLSALTAWQGLFEHGVLDKAGLKGNEEARMRNAGVRVLVTGATGGVGGWVVQLAALAGAGAVVALCGPSKGDVARRLGATEVVDYSRTSIAEWAGEDAALECHLVIDCVGGEALVGCWSAVREGGVLLSIAGLPDAVKPEGVSKTLAKSSWFLVEALGSNLAEITELIDAGKIRPVVDSVWEFEDFGKAFEKLETGHPTGKIIIKVD